MTEENVKDLISAIVGLSVSIDEHATEVQELRQAIENLEETIKTTPFVE